jgi:hypothetical protein
VWPQNTLSRLRIPHRVCNVGFPWRRFSEQELDGIITALNLTCRPDNAKLNPEKAIQNPSNPAGNGRTTIVVNRTKSIAVNIFRRVSLCFP